MSKNLSSKVVEQSCRTKLLKKSCQTKLSNKAVKKVVEQNWQTDLSNIAVNQSCWPRLSNKVIDQSCRPRLSNKVFEPGFWTKLYCKSQKCSPLTYLALADVPSKWVNRVDWRLMLFTLSLTWTSAPPYPTLSKIIQRFTRILPKIVMPTNCSDIEIRLM